MLIKWEKEFLALDKESGCFLKLNELGKITQTIDNEYLKYPNSLDTNKNEIIVANTWANNVLIFDKNFTLIKTIDFKFSEPCDVTFYNNYLYVCNRDIHTIEVFDESYKHVKSYPDINTLKLYKNIPLFMPTSIKWLMNTLYICQINNLTAIDINGSFLFNKKNDKTFDEIKTNGKHLFVLNHLDNAIDIYGESGIYLSSIQLPKNISFQTFEILENEIICFTLFYENCFKFPINNIPNENNILMKSADTPYELMKLAKLYKENNNFDKMLNVYEKILKIYPGFPPVMEILDQLLIEIKQ